MKRFYQQAEVVADLSIALDGRPVRTPGRALLQLPSPRLAESIADEWNRQGETIDPRSMKLTGLANAAIDRIAPDCGAFARGLAVYGESDLLCYRAGEPMALKERQQSLWDPILAWAGRRFETVFETTCGIIHRPQPPSTLERLRQAVAARSAWELAGLSPLVTVSGSLIIALALAEQAIDLETAWSAATLDEAWQAEKWGRDEEAALMLEARRSDFEAGALFLTLL